MLLILFVLIRLIDQWMCWIAAIMATKMIATEIATATILVTSNNGFNSFLYWSYFLSNLSHRCNHLTNFLYYWFLNILYQQIWLINCIVFLYLSRMAEMFLQGIDSCGNSVESHCQWQCITININNRCFCRWFGTGNRYRMDRMFGMNSCIHIMASAGQIACRTINGKQQNRRNLIEEKKIKNIRNYPNKLTINWNMVDAWWLIVVWIFWYYLG